MTSSQSKHIRSFLPSLNFEHRAQTDKLAQRLEFLVYVPRPDNRADEQWHEERRKNVRFSERENANHEE